MGKRALPPAGHRSVATAQDRRPRPRRRDRSLPTDAHTATATREPCLVSEQRLPEHPAVHLPPSSAPRGPIPLSYHPIQSAAIMSRRRPSSLKNVVQKFDVCEESLVSCIYWVAGPVGCPLQNSC